MKKGVNVAIVLISVLIVLLIIFGTNIIQFAPFVPPIPENCSNESIKMLWDSIYEESSDGITIVLNTTEEFIDGCPIYIAYKINEPELNILYGLDFWFFADIKLITAVNGNFTDEYLNNIRGITAAELPFFIYSDFINVSESIPREISLDEAEDEFLSTYKITPEVSWAVKTFEKNTVYSYNDTFETDKNVTSNIGFVYLNYTLNQITFADLAIPDIFCEPLWEAVNTSCGEDGTLTTYYNDSELCENPFNYAPENETHSCVNEEINDTPVELIDKCDPEWTCSDWVPSECSSGIKRDRVCTDENSCGNETGKPLETETCEVICVPDWDCSDWSPEDCPKDGVQNRVCTDNNSCGTSGKPNEKISCEYENPLLTTNMLIVWGVSGLIILILIILLVVYLVKKSGTGNRAKGAGVAPPPPPLNKGGSQMQQST